MAEEIQESNELININKLDISSQPVSLSNRGNKNYEGVAPKLDAIAKVFGNLYDKDNNPNGLINLGIAENSLLADEILDYYNKNNNINKVDLTYGDSLSCGQELARAMKVFYNNTLKPLQPFEGKDFIVGVGMSAVISQLAFYLGDVGDGILIGTPYYNGFDVDLTAQSQLKPIQVDFSENVDPISVEGLRYFEKALVESEKNGTKIRALLTSNPHNPIGYPLSKETLIEYGKFCEKHNIHLISDEIYALSTFKSSDIPNPPEFISASSINWYEFNVNPSRVHITVGASKDFASNGLRIGVLISQFNQNLIKAMMASSLLMKLSSPSDKMWRTLLSDKKFLDWYIPENQNKLSESYEFVTSWCKKVGVPYSKACAGFFFMIDLSNWLPTHSRVSGKELKGIERVQELTLRMIDNGVLLNAGTNYHHKIHGFYRLTHTLHKDVAQVGLERLEKTLKDIELESSNKFK